MVNKIFQQFFDEDLPDGDITTEAIFGAQKQKVTAKLLAKQDLVLSGLKVGQGFLRVMFPSLKLKAFFYDGDFCRRGDVLAEIHGPVSELLKAERIFLNLVQRMSGIATMTRKFVDEVKPLTVSILDTRKTTPGLRAFERLAVRDGGGKNHRDNLSEAYLIKDNHIASAGSVTKALQRVMEHRKRSRKKRLIEVEVKNLPELDEALALSPDIILLDNMSPKMIGRCVQRRNMRNPKVLLEVSGAVTLDNVKSYAATGVERISIGALTHSAPAVDISLKINIKNNKFL